jgi:hypothetical protein
LRPQKVEKNNPDQNIFEVFFYSCHSKFSPNAKPGFCDGDNSVDKRMESPAEGSRESVDQTLANV